MNTAWIPSVFVPLVAIACTPGCARDAAVAADGGSQELEPTSITVFGERVLLFMEHPHLVQDVPARFLAHFTVLATGEPIRAGTVTLEIGPARFVAEGPKRDGLFLPEGAVAEAGTHPARIVVHSEQAEETLDLGELRVHASQAEAAREVAARLESESPDAVPFLLEQQWKVQLLLAQASPRVLREHLEVPARARAIEGRLAVVLPPVGGTLLAANGADALPRTGDRVEAGQILALVEPPLGAAERAELRALRLELDLEALGVLRATSEARARLRFAEREHERIERLRSEGLGTQQELEQARHELALARTEIDAAERMSESLERLVERSGGVEQLAPLEALRFPLSAPIGGILVESRALPGAAVAPDQSVFRILDASRVWVEGRVSELEIARIQGASSAVARFAAIPGRRFELSGDGAPYLAPEVEETSHTVLVRYEIANEDRSIRPGMLADLQIVTGERRAQVVVPRETVVMDQGLPTAYVMLEGELFQKRTLELGISDGEWVEVVRGIETGERVATRGAYVVKLAALSPASFGAGHAH